MTNPWKHEHCGIVAVFRPSECLFLTTEKGCLFLKSDCCAKNCPDHHERSCDLNPFGFVKEKTDDRKKLVMFKINECAYIKKHMCGATGWHCECRNIEIVSDCPHNPNGKVQNEQG